MKYQFVFVAWQMSAIVQHVQKAYAAVLPPERNKKSETKLIVLKIVFLCFQTK